MMVEARLQCNAGLMGKACEGKINDCVMMKGMKGYQAYASIKHNIYDENGILSDPHSIHDLQLAPRLPHWKDTNKDPIHVTKHPVVFRNEWKVRCRYMPDTIPSRIAHLCERYGVSG